MPLPRLKNALKIRAALPAPLPAAELLDHPVEGYFNAAFLPGSGPMEVVCREAYYQLDGRSFMIGGAVMAKTRNALVRIEGRAAAAVTALPAFDELEDVRLFPHGDGLFLFAVGYQPGEAGPRQAPVIGRARREAGGLALDKRFATEEVQAVEKNWVFFEQAGALRIEKFPGMAEIYEVDPATLALRHRRIGDLGFDWSGTKAVTLPSGSLFLDHKRIYILRGARTVQRYIYRFRLVPDAEAAVTRVSKPFSLGRAARLTYASDIALSPCGKALLIAASYDDNSFELFASPLPQVMATLR